VCLLRKVLGGIAARADHGGAISEMKNFPERRADVDKALRVLRRQGLAVGLPMQTASGDMLFAVEGFTVSAHQILELLDRDELDLRGVRRLIGAQTHEAK
jgi:hypothetical protein